MVNSLCSVRSVEFVEESTTKLYTVLACEGVIPIRGEVGMKSEVTWFP